jgi:energy-converting hydrogenase Eha subunit A
MTMRWWTPRRADWWVAVLFIVGAACFALGSLPLYAIAVGPTADAVTYFIGSLLFTSAALLQFLISTGSVHAEARPLASVLWRRMVNSPRSAQWWAGAVQFAGTLLFNLSTFAAMHQNLTVTEADRRVWAPDAFGSIAFLLAGALAYADVARPWLAWRPRDIGWSVAMLNMAGSIAFGVSAIAAKVLPSTGDLRNAELANLGTFAGALGFLFGAVLLIPDQADADAAVGGATG